MLQKVYRLVEKNDFQSVLRNGSSVQGSFLGLFFLSNKGVGQTKTGFVVSNKISKKATIRNRLKRLLREVVRQNVYNIKEGFLLVFLAEKSIVDARPELVKEEVLNLLTKASLLNNENNCFKKH